LNYVISYWKPKIDVGSTSAINQVMSVRILREKHQSGHSSDYTNAVRPQRFGSSGKLIWYRFRDKIPVPDERQPKFP